MYRLLSFVFLLVVVGVVVVGVALRLLMIVVLMAAVMRGTPRMHRLDGVHIGRTGLRRPAGSDSLSRDGSRDGDSRDVLLCGCFLAIGSKNGGVMFCVMVTKVSARGKTEMDGSAACPNSPSSDGVQLGASLPTSLAVAENSDCLLSERSV